MRILFLAILILALSPLAPAATAQLPELEGEDVPRQAPLRPPSPAGQPDSHQNGEPRATFGDTVDVALSFHVVRVLDKSGAPVLGLGSEDFRAIGEGGEPRTVVAAEWQDSGRAVDGWTTPRRGASASREEAADADGAAATAAAPAGTRLAELPGKLVVVFVQADFNGRRIYGHLKQLPNVAELLSTLAPRDRVAVVSFDSHMELWQDFTTDRGAAREAVWKAIHFGADPPEDDLPEEARPANPETPSLTALRRSNASVFVLDVMDAAGHTLEIGLKRVAAQTGGVYVRTATNPMQAFRRVAQALSGHYLVTLDRPDGTTGPVTFSVKGRERGTRVLSHRVRLP